MSDIFISYSSNDCPWVERFAKTLEEHGWSVWWDREIPTGGSFNQVIRQQLGAAKCAIVVWSEESVESEWVQSEAAEAKQQNKYLPIKINECELPLGFSQRTYQSLVEWDSGVDHAGFSQLLKDVERLVKSPAKQITVVPKPWWKRVHPIWLVSAPAVLAAVGALGLMLWTVAGQVAVELTTERIEFVIGAKQSEAEDSYTLSGMLADSVSIENFETITITPKTIEVADPSLYQLEEDSYPDKAWRKLALIQSELTVAANRQTQLSRVIVESGGEPIKLDSLVAKPGARVSLETRENKEDKTKKDKKESSERREGLTIKVAGQKEFIISPGHQFKMIADHVEMRGIKNMPFAQDGEFTYRLTLPEQPSRVIVHQRSDQLVLLPTFVLGKSAHQVFGGIPVTTLDFTRQASEADGDNKKTYIKAGDRISALTGNGTITFPGYEDLLGAVSIQKDEAVGLEHLDGFTIQELSLPADGSGIYLKGEGMAKEIRTKSGQIPIQSHRLTALDALWHNARLAMVVTIIATVFTTSLGAYRLWKEFKH